MNIEKVNYEIMFKFRIKRYMENIHTNYEFDRIHKVLKKLNCSLAAFIGSLQLVRHSLASLVFFWKLESCIKRHLSANDGSEWLRERAIDSLVV